MMDLYFWTTPNGYKIAIFLEEAGLAYRLRPVDITRNEQFQPEFLKISPNNKIPALVDEGLSIFESGAILWYLAEKTGQFLPKSIPGKVKVSEWLFWQVGGLGPMAGQNHHFTKYAPEKIPYAIDRYTKETARLYGVLDRQLTGREYVAGEFSIADMAIYPWIVPHETQGQDLAEFPGIEAWFERMRARPAVQRAYAIKI